MALKTTAFSGLRELWHGQFLQILRWVSGLHRTLFLSQITCFYSSCTIVTL